MLALDNMDGDGNDGVDTGNFYDLLKSAVVNDFGNGATDSLKRGITEYEEIDYLPRFDGAVSDQKDAEITLARLDVIHKLCGETGVCPEIFDLM